MPALDLSGAERERLSEILGAAFPLRRLRELLDVKLERDLEDISLGADYREIRFELIKDAERCGYTAELVVAAREANPGHAALVAFAGDFRLASATRELESVLGTAATYFDPVAFRARLGRLEGQVCRIELVHDGVRSFGTGFL